MHSLITDTMCVWDLMPMILFNTHECTRPTTPPHPKKITALIPHAPSTLTPPLLLAILAP
jgi:hypothetical protein